MWSLIILLLFLLITPLMAQAIAFPKGGESLAGDNPLELLDLAGAQREHAHVERLLDEQGRPILRVSTLRPTLQGGAISLQLANTGRIRNGDVLYVGFRARLIQTTAEIGDGRLGVLWHVPRCEGSATCG